MAHPVDEVVHAVDIAEEGGLSATRRTDVGGDLAFGDVHAYAMDGLILAVVERKVVDLDIGGV